MNSSLVDLSPAEAAPIHTRGALTVAEVISAARLSPPLRDKIATWIMRAMLGMSFLFAHGLLALVYLRGGISPARIPLALALFVDFGIVSAAIRYLWSRRELERAHRDGRLVFMPTEGRIDEAGIYTRAETFEQSVGWRQFVGYRANEMVVVLYFVYPKSYTILGRSQFASDTDWLRAVSLVAGKLPRL